RGALPLQALDEATRAMNEVVAQQIRRLKLKEAPFNGTPSLHANLRTLHDASIPTYLATLTLSAKLFALHSLVMHPNLLAVAKELGVSFPCFQTQPVIHLAADDLKIPGGYQGFDAHQDWPALQSGLDTLVTWIPFMDVGRNMYGMDVIPGSHLQGLCEGEQTQHVYSVAKKHCPEERFIPVEVRRGDVFIMSVFLVHRSSSVGTPETFRLSVSARYENAAEPTFIERGYPFTQKRVVERNLLTPNFPSVNQVRKLFGL
ncbi:MAG: phytanoyl-CoA dioxygenase family protein, partial [Bdellovibrionota bacterium]